MSVGVMAAISSKSSVASSSMTSMASSMVTMPTRRCSLSTTGIAKKSYLLRSWATSSRSSIVEADTTFVSMMSSITSSWSASSRVRMDTSPSRRRLVSVT